jgi:HK97 family phage major capsid protein
MYDKRNREALGRAVDQMQGIIARCKREGNRGLTAAERTQFERLEQEYSRLEEKIEANEADGINGSLQRSGGRINHLNLPEIQDTFRLTPGQVRERNKDPYAKAFSQFLRGGMESLDVDGRELLRAKFQTGGIQNAQSGTTGSQGGYIIPQGFANQLEEAKKWFGGIDAGFVGRFRTESGNPFPWPTINDTSNMGHIIGQNVQVEETDFVFGQTTFNAYIFTSDIVLIPLALMQDSFFDLDALTARLLGTRLGRLYNYKCTLGTGSGEPTGIVTAAVAAGNIYTMPTGETAAISYQDLVNIEHSVDPAYRYNPTTAWMFSDAQLKLIKKLVDGQNRPLWQPGLSASFREGATVDITSSRPTIMGHPYLINQNMPTPAANAYSILFGDLNTFKVRQVGEGATVMRLVERYADYLQVGFIAWERADSNLIDAGTHPIVLGQNSAT